MLYATAPHSEALAVLGSQKLLHSDKLAACCTVYVAAPHSEALFVTLGRVSDTLPGAKTSTTSDSALGRHRRRKHLNTSQLNQAVLQLVSPDPASPQISHRGPEDHPQPCQAYAKRRGKLRKYVYTN
eukprot:1727835-Amphidinium_carterae.1